MEEKTMNDEVVMGFPLAASTQATFAEMMQETIQASDSKIIGAWCRETQFFLAAHIAEGKPCYWECCGPITEDQANQLAVVLEDRDAMCRIAV